MSIAKKRVKIVNTLIYFMKLAYLVCISYVKALDIFFTHLFSIIGNSSILQLNPMIRMFKNMKIVMESL